ncbi:MAG: hypothetical protein HQL01_11960 [Nitrospirae bacterium]|nr:hypothetical protein [Nitrospirota bacterium]
MNEVLTWHRKAMDYAEEAFYHKLKGDPAKVKEFFLLAYELELKAAESYKDSTLEPTRSVLYRSAATLAYDCDKLREAERLVAIALSGEPPDEIAEELRDLLEDIYFKRHLKIHDIEIDSSTLQMSISGEAVGYGMAKLGEFIPRIQNTEKIINRTIDRKYNLPYREGGRGKQSIRKNECYMSVPKAACLSVAIRIGSPIGQTDLFPPTDIIDEVIECFELFSDSNIKSLKEHIPDDAYFRNFVGLYKKIEPDGENIKTVGFTVIRNGKERAVSLKKRTDFIVAMDEKTIPSKQELTTVTGQLLFADSIKKQEIIKIKDENGHLHKIKVPEGMMSDIVRPLWDNTVTVKGYYTDKGIITLEDIQKADE